MLGPHWLPRLYTSLLVNITGCCVYVKKNKKDSQMATTYTCMHICVHVFIRRGYKAYGKAPGQHMLVYICTEDIKRRPKGHQVESMGNQDNTYT